MRTAACGALLALAACAAGAAEAPVLFRNASLVTLDVPGTLANHDLLVTDGRIARIAPAGRIEAPEGATVVDAKGRWLIPGLAEMHAHVPGPEPAGAAEDVLLMYLAHGQTTIRGMLGQASHLDLRARLAAGELSGPRFFTSGPSVNGKSAPDPDTAERMVREQREAGYDFVKLHPGLARTVFDRIVAVADEVGIPWSGHVSEDVGLARALEARQSAIDHLDGYLQALADPACAGRVDSPGFFGIGLTPCADEARIPELVAATKRAGTWMAPTQVLIERWANPPAEKALAAQSSWRLVAPTTRAQWAQARARFAGAGPAPRYVALRRSLLRQMHAAGVPILLASDAPQVFNVPGDAALAELELYGEIGLTPLEALATGTTNVARFYGQEDRFGRLREGLEADIVMLAADPLVDLANVRRIEGVMTRGRWLPRASLDSILDAVATRQSKR